MSSMRSALAATSSFPLAPPAQGSGRSNIPTVAADGADLRLNAGNGRVLISGTACSDVDMCSAMAAIDQIAQSLLAAGEASP
eukprot:m.524265 g.524265  ORF g.524265 m.524265 type:complete len:82 (+) comp21986_c0_seq5:640-885(+)